MKKLMGDRLHPVLVIRVEGNARVGREPVQVEQVQALVFHASDSTVEHAALEGVQVVFAAVNLFVPLDGPLQKFHGVRDLADVLARRVDLDFHPPAALEAVAAGHRLELAGTDCEEITGCGHGVVPDREMPAPGQVALGLEIASREQHRVVRLDRHEPCGEFAEQVGPVLEVGQASERLGLAMGVQPAVPGFAEAHQRHVAGRHDAVADFQFECFGQTLEYQLPVVQFVLVFAQGPAVDAHGQKLEVPGVQQQGRLRPGISVAGVDRAAGNLDAVEVAEIEFQIHVIDEVVRLPIVPAMHRGGYGRRRNRLLLSHAGPFEGFKNRIIFL